MINFHLKDFSLTQVDGGPVVVTAKVNDFDGGATYGPLALDDPYRYHLWRRVGPGARRVLFLLLNPSTATHMVDDPTIRRCAGYAQRWGFGVLEVANIFALRSTDPRALYRNDPGFDPVGAFNDAQILEAAGRCQFTVCGWGTHGAVRSRGHQVLGILRRAKIDRRCLKKTKHGDPAHPLYLRADLSPVFL